MKNGHQKEYIHIAIYAFIVIAASGLFIFMIVGAREYLASKQYTNVFSIFNPFIYGFAFAYLLNPLVKFFENQVFVRLKTKPKPKGGGGVKRILSLISAYLVTIIAIGLIALMVIPQIGASINQLAGKTADLFVVVEDVEAYKNSSEFNSFFRRTPIDEEPARVVPTVAVSLPKMDMEETLEENGEYLYYDPENNVFIYDDPLSGQAGESLDYELISNTKIGIYVTEAAAMLQEFVSRFGLHVDIEQTASDLFLRFTANITVLFGDYFTTIINTAASILYAAARQVLNVLLGLIISFYILMEKERFIGQFKKVLFAFFPIGFSHKMVNVARKTHTIFGGFITGKILDSMIVGLICFICMSIFKINYPVLVSVIIGVSNLIPFFGPFIGAIPCIFFLIINDVGQGLWFAVFILILQQVDGNIIDPKIVGSSIGLSAVWVIFAILVMNGLFGMFGMFVGVPVFAVVYTLIKEYAAVRLHKKGLPITTEGYIDFPDEPASLPDETSVNAEAEMGTVGWMSRVYKNMLYRPAEHLYRNIYNRVVKSIAAHVAAQGEEQNPSAEALAQSEESEAQSPPEQDTSETQDDARR